MVARDTSEQPHERAPVSAASPAFVSMIIIAIINCTDFHQQYSASIAPSPSLPVHLRHGGHCRRAWRHPDTHTRHRRRSSTGFAPLAAQQGVGIDGRPPLRLRAAIAIAVRRPLHGAPGLTSAASICANGSSVRRSSDSHQHDTAPVSHAPSRSSPKTAITAGIASAHRGGPPHAERGCHR